MVENDLSPFLDQVFCGDCLEVMEWLPSGYVDMVLCDLPYGTTRNKWDSVIPTPALWDQYRRVLKPGGVVVLTAAQPFTSTLVNSNLPWFKYEWIWSKVRVTGHLNAKKQPMRGHETVLVFYQSQCTYNPQMTPSGGHVRGPFGRQKNRTTNYGTFSDDNRTHEASEYYPRSIIEFLAEMQSVHPTQKPVALWEYLIRTYTNKGDVVLDNCCGSGTTGVACAQTGRRSIQIDISPDYCAIADTRLRQALAEAGRA